MDIVFLGYLAGIGTSLMFSIGSNFFTFAGRQIGSAVVNRVRLVFAVVFIMLVHFLFYGTPFPFNAEPERFFFFGLSGFIGYALGDAFLFQGFVMVGPRLSMLMMSLAPVLSVILAFLFLNERLETQELIGIIIVVSGVLFVVSDNKAGNQSSQAITGSRDYWIGLGFALGGAVGQAVGLVLSKRGLEGDFSPISGNVIRLMTAMISIWIFTILAGQFSNTFRKLKERPDSFKYLIAGTISGPVIAVSLGLFSTQNVPAGIASTLQALMPIFLIPISYFVYGEKPTLRGLIGTVIVFTGILLLFVHFT
jgi:drug/metabolite transporter (DMT)-like permease